MTTKNDKPADAAPVAAGPAEGVETEADAPVVPLGAGVSDDWSHLLPSR